MIPGCKQPAPRPAPQAIYNRTTPQQHGRVQKQAPIRLEQASPAGRREAVAGALQAEGAFARQDAQQHRLAAACLGEDVDQKALQADRLRRRQVLRAVLAHLRQCVATHKAELKEEKELMEWGEPPVGPQVPWILAEDTCLARQAAHPGCEDKLPSSHGQPRGHTADPAAAPSFPQQASPPSPTPARPTSSIRSTGMAPSSCSPCSHPWLLSQSSYVVQSDSLRDLVCRVIIRLRSSHTYVLCTSSMPASEVDLSCQDRCILLSAVLAAAPPPPPPVS